MVLHHVMFIYASEKLRWICLFMVHVRENSTWVWEDVVHVNN